MKDVRSPGLPIGLVQTGFFNKAPLGSFVWPHYSYEFETALIVWHKGDRCLFMLEGPRQYRLFPLEDDEPRYDFGSWVQAASIEIDPSRRWPAPKVGSIVLVEGGAGLHYRDQHGDHSHDLCYLRLAAAQANPSGHRVFGYDSWQVVACHEGTRFELFNSVEESA